MPSIFDWIRIQGLIYEESRRIQDILIERFVAPALRTSTTAPKGAPPDEASGEARQGSGEREVIELMRRAQLALLRHPIAAQAAFATLVAEGRRFAATPEGALWKEALASSELLRKGRRVWDAVSFNMLEDDPNTILPSAYLEALLRAARSVDLDALLNALHDAPKGSERAAAR